MKLLAAVLAAASLTGAAAPAVPHLDHVVVIVFENEERSEVLGSGLAPAFDRYDARSADLTQYYARTHPSLPNYLALVSGSTQGIADDCTSCSARGPSIGTLLERAGRSWGAFAEGYPDSPRFVKRHVPFLYFAGQSSHVHPLSALHPSALPAYSLVVPDLCNDMHDCSVATGDRWLARFLPPLLHLPRTAIFVMFDEGTTDEHGGGHVAAFVAGTAVRPGSKTAQRSGHYVLLRTIEDALGLPHLGETAHERPLEGIWR